MSSPSDFKKKSQILWKWAKQDQREIAIYGVIQHSLILFCEAVVKDSSVFAIPSPQYPCLQGFESAFKLPKGPEVPAGKLQVMKRTQSSSNLHSPTSNPASSPEIPLKDVVRLKISSKPQTMTSTRLVSGHHEENPPPGLSLPISSSSSSPMQISPTINNSTNLGTRRGSRARHHPPGYYAKPIGESDEEGSNDIIYSSQPELYATEHTTRIPDFCWHLFSEHSGIPRLAFILEAKAYANDDTKVYDIFCNTYKQVFVQAQHAFNPLNQPHFSVAKELGAFMYVGDCWTFITFEKEDFKPVSKGTWIDPPYTPDVDPFAPPEPVQFICAEFLEKKLTRQGVPFFKWSNFEQSCDALTAIVDWVRHTNEDFLTH